MRVACSVDVNALLVHLAVAALLVAVPLVVSSLLGERHRQRCTHEPYESGMPTAGTGSGRLSPSFFMIAALFVLFDLEVVFLFAWAVGAGQLGLAGFVEAAVFAGVLLLGLVYVVRASEAFRRTGPRTGGRRT